MNVGADMPFISLESGRFGALGPGFTHQLQPGYTALVGRNNAGKSTVLQLIYRSLLDHADFGRDRVAYVPPDRAVLPTAMETGGRSLLDYNDNFVASIRGESVWPYDGSRGASSAELARLLLTHTDLIQQVNSVDRLLEELGLPVVRIKGAQQMHFEDVQAHFQGSGLRALFPVLCAVSDSQLKAILIDEPEASLHPGLQRALRDSLIREADGRLIVVATQSHLLIDRSKPSATCEMVRDDDGVSVRRIGADRELLGVVYELLGNSTEDLLLPGNFLLVEGAFDEAILERVLELLGSPPGRVKVIAAEGLSRVGATARAIEAALRPIVTGDSPYARSIVALVDGALAESDKRLIEELRELLGQRLFELPITSIEEYLSASLFEAAGLDKEQELVNIAAAKGRWEELRRAKMAIASVLATALAAEHLDDIPMIAAAARAAMRLRE